VGTAHVLFRTADSFCVTNVLTARLFVHINTTKLHIASFDFTAGWSANNCCAARKHTPDVQ
jgi:hypothetical protein